MIKEEASLSVWIRLEEVPFRLRPYESKAKVTGCVGLVTGSPQLT